MEQNPNETPVEVAEVKQAQIETLAEAKRQYVDKVVSLDAKIMALQNSTKTTIPGMGRLHNFFRMKMRWYYNWHINPISNKVHWVLLVAISFTLIYWAFVIRAN